MVLFGAIVHMAAGTLARYERALGREHALRIAGGMLIAATDTKHVGTATREGAESLLAGTAGAGVSISLNDAVGKKMGRALTAGEAVERPLADAGTWQELGLSGQPGALYVVPLHARGALEGTLAVGSVEPLDDELKDDLRTLAALAALAVEDVTLARG